MWREHGCMLPLRVLNDDTFDTNTRTTRAEASVARQKTNRPAPAKRTDAEGSGSKPRRPLPQASDKPERNWWPWALGGTGVVVLVAFIYFVSAGLTSEVSGIPDGVVDVPVDGALHVDGEVDYGEHPAGGDHNAIWLNCGRYDQPVPEENAVHSLEHGAIWITYPTGSDSVFVDALAPYANQLKVIVSPVDGQTSPVLVTGWGVQLETDDPADSRIDQFIAAFIGGGNAPEPGGRCDGGVGQPL